MSLSGTIKAILNLTLTDPASVWGSDPSDAMSYTFSKSLADGSGDDQAQQLFHLSGTLAAAASVTYDLAGGATFKDVFGRTITLTAIKALYIENDGTASGIKVGGGSDGSGTAALASLFGATNDKLIVKPSGAILAVAPKAGYAVSAGTADILRLEHDSTSSDTVTYNIAIVGVGTAA